MQQVVAFVVNIMHLSELFCRHFLFNRKYTKKS